MYVYLAHWYWIFGIGMCNECISLLYIWHSRRFVQRMSMLPFWCWTCGHSNRFTKWVSTLHINIGYRISYNLYIVNPHLWRHAIVMKSLHYFVRMARWAIRFTRMARTPGTIPYIMDIGVPVQLLQTPPVVPLPSCSSNPIQAPVWRHSRNACWAYSEQQQTKWRVLHGE